MHGRWQLAELARAARSTRREWQLVELVGTYGPQAGLAKQYDVHLW